MAIPKSNKPLDVLQQMFSEVLVQTGKALRTANRDGKDANAQASVIANPRIPASIETFNAALDELENDLLRAKAVLQRDLNQLRASRRPPPDKKPVAPPAPMVVDLNSPTITKVSVPQTFQSPNRPTKQDNKPVAPFPNMGGFDLTVSPEVAPTPSPKMLPKSKEPKNSPRPAMMANATGRPSAPPRKETKVPIPTIPRSAVATPQAPPPSALPPKTPVVAAPSVPTPKVVQNTAPPPAPIQTPVPIPQVPLPPVPMPAPGSENIFSDMNFSLALPSSDGSNPNQTQQPDIDLVALGAGGDISSSFNMDDFGNGGGNGPADVANMDLTGGTGGSNDIDISNVDAKIDGLFDLGSAGIDNMEMDYDLSGDAGDNSNFDDMFFNTGDDNMGSTNFDNTYFNLE
ncbi:hypothetical protein B0T25DRAFT_538516 [Lasiosphaeria hispida]|uniref:Uncharacterized protein n=1 Tax=Lasiosphaeria hispida TaxID=260671 RepID=A0AAJ0HLP7_9PEZI|nr:hypothetical protein B0T25DRAFT_538516 [Lasiosphaeria hispida]